MNFSTPGEDRRASSLPLDRFSNGKLTEHDGEMDEDSLIEQLALPSESEPTKT